MLKPSRDKNKGAYHGGQGGKTLLSDPGPELRLGREKEHKIANTIEWDEQNKNKKKEWSKINSICLVSADVLVTRGFCLVCCFRW